MLISTEVEVGLNGKSVKYYENLGYKIPKELDNRGRLRIIQGSKITVKICDLQENSNAKVNVSCDYCHEDGIETIISKPYSEYNKTRRTQPIAKDACGKCKHKKQEEICFIKNGVKYSPQIAGVGNKISITNSKYNIDEIDEEFKERNLVLLSKTYENTKSYMDFICNKHQDKGVQSILYANFKYKNQDCKYCAWDKLSESRRKDFNEVENLFKIKNTILLSNEEDYINNHSELKYECPIHKGIIQTATYSGMSNSLGCTLCSNDRLSGENNYNWKGGFSEINSILRDSITEWKKESMIASNYKCVVTNKRFDVIHHLYGFDKIFNEIFDNLNIEKRRFINEYEDSELILIKNECARLHKIHGVGVCLTGDIHALFHKVYGYGENNVEQFNEFKEDYINGKYKDLEEVG